VIRHKRVSQPGLGNNNKMELATTPGIQRKNRSTLTVVCWKQEHEDDNNDERSGIHQQDSIPEREECAPVFVLISHPNKRVGTGFDG
jgi:hypothetical protein